MIWQARPSELVFNPIQMWSRQKYFAMVVRSTTLVLMNKFVMAQSSMSYVDESRKFLN